MILFNKINKKQSTKLIFSAIILLTIFIPFITLICHQSFGIKAYYYGSFIALTDETTFHINPKFRLFTQLFYKQYYRKLYNKLSQELEHNNYQKVFDILNKEINHKKYNNIKERIKNPKLSDSWFNENVLLLHLDYKIFYLFRTIASINNKIVAIMNITKYLETRGLIKPQYLEHVITPLVNAQVIVNKLDDNSIISKLSIFYLDIHKINDITYFNHYYQKNKKLASRTYLIKLENYFNNIAILNPMSQNHFTSNGAVVVYNTIMTQMKKKYNLKILNTNENKKYTFLTKYPIIDFRNNLRRYHFFQSFYYPQIDKNLQISNIKPKNIKLNKNIASHPMFKGKEESSLVTPMKQTINLKALNNKTVLIYHRSNFAGLGSPFDTLFYGTFKKTISIYGNIISNKEKLKIVSEFNKKYNPDYIIIIDAINWKQKKEIKQNDISKYYEIEKLELVSE